MEDNKIGQLQQSQVNSKEEVKNRGGFYDSDSDEEDNQKQQQVIVVAQSQMRSNQTQLGNDPSTNNQNASGTNYQITQLESTIQEYKNKLAQLEKVLKEEDEVRNDPEKKEEVEKLRDQLREHFIMQQNQLKFLQNQQVKLTVQEHTDKVCEAYFENEKMWFAALILEIFENTQEAEVAWIGYKMQTKLPVKYLKVLEPPELSEFFEGALCNAVNSSDGMWYPCTIEKIFQDSDGQDISKELKPLLQKYQVKFKHSNQKVTVPLDYIRLTRDQMIQNERKRQMIENGETLDQPIGEFQIPESLRLKRGDTDKVKLQKRKKVKALKQQYKIKKQEINSKERQNSWLDFKNKGATQKAGHFAFNKNDSIFKSPDSVQGKVGVIGSGQQMTDYDSTRIKYQQTFKNTQGINSNSEANDLSTLGKRRRFN